MEQSVWNYYWKKQGEISLNTIIAKDNYYKLLKSLIGPQNKYRSIKLLEAGCGTGSRSMALIKDFCNINWEITLLDSSEVALLFAKSLALKNGIMPKVRLVKGNILRMSFPNDTFDIVWNEGVNEHFDGHERNKVFEEMARVTKENGLLIVLVPNALNLPYRIRKRVMELTGCWEYGFEKPFTIFELTKIIKKLNFHEIRTGGDRIFDTLPEFFKMYLCDFFLKRSKPKIQKSIFTNIKKKAGGLKFLFIVLKSIFMVMDIALVPIFGKFIGSNIGIRGVKKNLYNES